MEKSNVKTYILQLLKQRNIKEQSFKEIVDYSNKLLESVDLYKNKNIHPHLQKELAECHIKMSGLADQVINLQDELNEKNLIITKQTAEIKELQSEIKTVLMENATYKAEVTCLKVTLQDRIDEYDTLNITYSSLENKWNALDIENRKLKEQLQMLMELGDRSLNSESLEPELPTNGVKCSGDSPDASLQKETVQEITSSFPKCASEGKFYSDAILPKRIKYEFVAHDSDVNAVLWLPDSSHILTAGADRRVKLWEICEDEICLNNVVRDCNSSVLSIDMDSESRFVLAASSDFASRVWTVSDFSLKHTLTGHSGKVVSSKFLKDQCKIVSGSTDQTLKLWDFGRRVCTVTYTTHSAVNDVLTKDANCLISGHCDNKIRFWDTRIDSETSNLQAGGRVTSLDLSKSGVYLLSSEDKKLKLYDVRTNKEINTMSAKNFAVGCSWTRAKLSHNNTYCCCGSKNGTIFIWNAFTGILEKELRADNCSVISCYWSSCGYLVTCGSNKKCVIWCK